MNKISLKEKIIGRIYLIYLLRKLGQPVFVRLFITAMAFIALLPFVSIRHVILNMPRLTDFNALYQFQLSAISHTELAVQFSIGLLLLVILSYTRDIFRNFSQRERLANA